MFYRDFLSGEHFQWGSELPVALLGGRKPAALGVEAQQDIHGRDSGHGQLMV